MANAAGATLAAVEAAAQQKAAARKQSEAFAARQEQLAALELEEQRQARERAQLAEEIRQALNNAPPCACLMYHRGALGVEMVDFVAAAAELDGGASWWGFCEKWEGSHQACYPPGAAVVEATRSPCSDAAMAYCRVMAPPRPSPPPLPHPPPPSPPPSPSPPHPSPPPSPSPPRPPRHPPRPRAPPRREIRGAERGAGDTTPSPRHPTGGGGGADGAGADVGYDTAAVAVLLVAAVAVLVCVKRARGASRALRLRAGGAPPASRVAAYLEAHLPSALLRAMPGWLLPVAGARLERVRRDEIAPEMASAEMAPPEAAAAEGTTEVAERGGHGGDGCGGDTDEGRSAMRDGAARAEPKQPRAAKKKKATRAARAPKKLSEEQVRIIVDEAPGPHDAAEAAIATKRSACAVFDL